MDHSQITYKNRNLTHNLCSNQSRRSNHNLGSNGPQSIRT